MIGQMSSSGTIIIFYSDKSTAEHSSLVDYLPQQINGKNCPKPILLHFPRWDPYKRTETPLIFCKVGIRTHRTVPNGRCNKIGWNSFFYLQFYDPNSNLPSKLKCSFSGWGQFLQSFCRSTSEFVISRVAKPRVM